MMFPASIGIRVVGDTSRSHRKQLDADLSYGYVVGSLPAFLSEAC